MWPAARADKASGLDGANFRLAPETQEPPIRPHVKREKPSWGLTCPGNTKDAHTVIAAREFTVTA
jgi:hypothetical protein